jgi:hypothetical protein
MGGHEFHLFGDKTHDFLTLQKSLPLGSLSQSLVIVGKSRALDRPRGMPEQLATGCPSKNQVGVRTGFQVLSGPHPVGDLTEQENRQPRVRTGSNGFDQATRGESFVGLLDQNGVERHPPKKFQPRR